MAMGQTFPSKVLSYYTREVFLQDVTFSYFLQQNDKLNISLSDEFSHAAFRQTFNLTTDK